MSSNAIEYYKSLRDQWVIWVRDENAPVLNKVEDKTYQLGRGNDLGIDVDLFISWADQYSNQSSEAPSTESEEEITNPFVDASDAVIADAIEEEVITTEAHPELVTGNSEDVTSNDNLVVTEVAAEDNDNLEINIVEETEEVVSE